MTRNPLKLVLYVFFGVIGVLTAGLLTSCGRPHVETRIQTVHCLTPNQFKKLVAAMPPKVGDQLNGQAQHDFKIAAGSDVALRFYANGLLDVIGGCTSGGTTP
jgi:hypothetical protein